MSANRNDLSEEPTPASKDSRRVSERSLRANAGPGWLVLSLPTLASFFIVMLSPNFQSSPVADELRATPLGADFVQEYAGGLIFASADRDRLYEPEHFVAVQHDPERMGFQWPEEDYFPMVYPPFYYAFTSLFSKLDYVWAMRVWVLLSGMAVSLSGWLLKRWFPPCRPLLGYLLFASLFFIPLLNNFNMAQKGSFILLILSAVFVLRYQGRPFAAGWVLGLLAFKPHLGLIVGLAMLVNRQWTVAAGALLMVATLVASSVLIGPDLWADYVQVVTSMSRYVETSGYQLKDSHSLWGATQLSLGWLGDVPVKVCAGAAMLLVGGLLVARIYRPASSDQTEFALQYSAVLIAMVMLSPHFYGYDLTALWLAFVLVGSTLPSDWRHRVPTRNTVYLMVALFAMFGLFPKMAEITRFQFSLPLLLAWLYWLPAKPKERAAKANYR